MIIGSILGWEGGRDDLFNPATPRNRDDCLEPFRALREYAKTKGIEFHTADVLLLQGLKADFRLHIESIATNIDHAIPEYLIRFETPLTVPLNANFDYLNHFKAVFTWDLDLLEGIGSNKGYQGIKQNKLIEIRTPNPIPAGICANTMPSGYGNRPIFCSLIASNRHANLPDDRELYSQRAKAIRWFEKNALDHFHLYGNGWRVPEKRFGFVGKMHYRSQKVIPFVTGKPVFPSYKGPAKTKNEILSRSKFSICFENAKDIRGYLTEKIFDCLFAGCIPIYWGEPNIEKWLPKECFIDFRQFDSYQDLYEYLTTMEESQFTRYQRAGHQFIFSQDFEQHSSTHFAKIIVDRIANDFS
jgi:hypothetical protein